MSVQTARTARAAAPVKKLVKGVLRIRITGLPTGVRPKVRVAGPGRYRMTVKRPRTLKRLTPGVYRVATPRVSTPAGSATGRPSKRRVRVSAGRTQRVTAKYVRTGTAPATPTDGTGITLGSPIATTVTDTGLDPDTTHSYAVFTRDTTGNTSPPATLTTATPSSPKISSVFNYPQPGQADPTIRNKLVQLLDQVPSGAQVSASFFIIYPDYPVVAALIAAHARGATVRVVLDSGYRQSTATNNAIDAAFARLVGELGSDPDAPSFAMQCDRACISKEEDSVQHNKFVLMSTAGDQSDVVFQTTANMSTTGSGEAEWNSAVVSSGNPELYASYEAYFADLAARLIVPGNNYNAVRPPTTYGKFTPPHYFPRTDGIDTVAQTLTSVNCTGSTQVNVMATHFVRTAVRDRLIQMSQSGCGVRVIARADNISREMCDSLVAQAVTVRVGDAPTSSKVGIHGKYLTVSGGADNRHLVWMGSHNLTNNALLRNDETFLLIDDQSAHDAFLDNFQTIWADRSMTPGCSTVP